MKAQTNKGNQTKLELIAANILFHISPKNERTKNPFLVNALLSTLTNRQKRSRIIQFLLLNYLGGFCWFVYNTRDTTLKEKIE